MSAEHIREQWARLKRIQYARRKAERKCVKCGRDLAERERVNCEKCRKEHGVLRRYSYRSAYWTNYRWELKLAVLKAYGTVCQCCGEDEPTFLAIDHMNNDGAQQRKKMCYRRSSYSFYIWLRKNGYPPDFQVLCHNCNIGRHLNGGVCPHKE